MTIIFVGGGTLGHIYPALPVIKAWKNENPTDFIVFMTTKKDNEKNVLMIPEINEIIELNVSGINRKNIFKNIKALRLIISANKEIRKQFKKIKPHLVIGMGGYLSGLVLKQAQRNKIPTIIHEQNSTLGLANRFVFKKATYLLSTFPLKVKRSYYLIGNPRQDDAKKVKTNKPNSFSVLVVSGSLGAEAINKTIVAFLKLKESHHYVTTLITGKRYYDDVIKDLSAKTTAHYQIIPFSNQMLSLMNKADIIISRAGATTLFEIIGLEKPAIIIPSPNVSNNHQEKNAKMFKDKHLGIVVNEKDFTKEKLNEILKFMFRPNNYEQYQKNLALLNKDSPTQKFIEFMKKAINK